MLLELRYRMGAVAERWIVHSEHLLLQRCQRRETRERASRDGRERVVGYVSWRMRAVGITLWDSRYSKDVRPESAPELRDLMELQLMYML